ncbi:aminotransferase-like domain-containing protein [Caproiciproducens faecalis]|uniref:PLP-dependent aminotransferase family protein n=1 Tax=Caproiciproducens faecalis TaxID=2820301 RepID=A0ABS7DJR1_9FIRM|nr:PLP-dependent aminotransferase family protein [Caproiciproducens faecalis]MBW7571534.1 PLP-dependent aminotransferase family protein [Caproiciproducens faecalis]
MEYQFSNRVLSLKPSAIREIFKYASDPSVISLSAGNPAPEAFPIKEVSEISARILSERPIDALQYSITEGYAPLREHLSSYMKKTHGVGRDFDNILITSGAQQVMDLATKSLCNEGDVVICEAPSFIGSLNTFRSYNCRLRGIPMESDGMDMTELEKALQEEANVRFIYTIPNFQNPSGITMSWEKRRQLYALAKKYGVLILEDNPYGDLRFYGEHIEAVKSLDEDGIVIYAGTFSKVISPGMRVGYAIAPQEILQKMIVCKQGEDVHTNIWSQIVCHELMTKYDFDAQLKRLREVYLKKSAIATGALDKYLAPMVTYQPIEGGLFLWCTLPDGVDMIDFCKQAVERKVCVVPGNAFLTNENDPCQSFRINFSTPTDIQLLKGIQILGELARELIRN